MSCIDPLPDVILDLVPHGGRTQNLLVLLQLLLELGVRDGRVAEDLATGDICALDLVVGLAEIEVGHEQRTDERDEGD